MWYLYIVLCKDNSLYTGITTDIKRRISEHNTGKGGACTAARRPVKLVYHEQRSSKGEALKREAQIKRWTHAKKIAFIDQNKTKLRQLSISRD
ncbi:GIY-YIG nuclease family protein [Candidatus Omnitrophota bacterium]